VIKSYQEQIEYHTKEYNEWKWLRDYINQYSDCGLMLDDAIGGMTREGNAITELLGELDEAKHEQQSEYADHIKSQRQILRRYKW
jgi:hypothetical protein